MRRGQHGFALLMVLLLISISAILGLTFLASSSIQRAGSKNLLSVMRAKYLAESGVQHAIYLCKNNPSQLAGSSSESLIGPYSADGSSDSYSFYGVPAPLVVGQWTLVGVGTCGGITQTSSVTVYRDGGTDFTNRQSMMSGGNITIPEGVSIIGDLTVSGTVTRTPVKVSSASIPSINWNNYKQYKLYSKTCNARQLYDSYLDPGNIPGDTCITAANPAGVAYVNGSVVLDANFTLKGTLVVNGNLYINGRGISITSVSGFPSLVVTGRIYVVDYAELTCDGMVYATQGMSPYIWITPNSKSKITGGFVSGVRGYDSVLSGSHQIIHSASRCKLYDPTGTVSDASSATIQVTAWND
jgi:hypothetical protein